MKLGKKVPIEPPLSFIELQRAAAVQVRAKYEHYEKYLQLIPALQGQTRSYRDRRVGLLPSRQARLLLHRSGLCLGLPRDVPPL